MHITRIEGDKEGVKVFFHQSPLINFLGEVCAVGGCGCGVPNQREKLKKKLLLERN
jgi:hypothetical protein